MSPDEAESTTTSFLAGRRKWAILAIAFVALAGVVFAWQSRRASPAAVTTTTGLVNSSTPPANNTTPTFQQVTVPVIADTDKDGLTDAREAELKTNPKLADSDGDELSDYDEVTVYTTNSLKQDTDGDGFPDGAEVRSGNNPKGAGTLFNLPQSISNINAR